MRLLSLSDLDNYRTTPGRRQLLSAIDSVIRPLLSIYIYILEHTLYTQCLSIRDRLPRFSDCSCDWQMGKKRGKSRKGSKAERDSEEEESATSQMSGTSSEKRRFAETREELREANRETEALRMAAAHETPTETPNIYGPGNIFDTDDDDDDDGDEIETLREANADLKRRLRKYNSTVGAATRLLIWKPHSLSPMPAHPPAVTKASDILALRKFLFD
jgi:hypothetical protein